jgi:hypothetical protein
MICDLIDLFYPSQDLVDPICFNIVAISQRNHQVEVRNQILYL